MPKPAGLGTHEPRATAFATAVVTRPWTVIALACLLIAAGAYGALALRVTNSYRVFFNPDNPELLAFEAVEKTFTKNDNVMLVLEPLTGDAFTVANLSALHALTEGAWKIPYTSRVDSLTNFQHTAAAGDELTVRDLVAAPATLDGPALAAVRATALAEPILAGNLVARDGRTAAVNVVVQLPGRDEQHEVPAVMAAAATLVQQIEAQYPAVRIHLTGVVAMDYAFSEAALHDAQTLVPAGFAVVFALVAVLMGGVVVGLSTALVVGFAVAAAMGLAGYLGYPLSPVISAAPVIILTVTVANCVHILDSFRRHWVPGRTRNAAIILAVSGNLRPIFLASFTTVIGFLSFNFSEVPPFRQLGNIVAFGDLASYALAVTLLPALLAVVPLREPQPCNQLAAGFARLVEFVIRHRRTVLLGSCVLMVAVLGNLPRNRLNDVFLHYFDQTTAFRRAADFTLAHLTGLYHLQYALGTGAAGGISEPAFLGEVAAFSTWLRAQPEVLQVSSFSDTLQRLNQNLHGDDPHAYQLPATRELAAQYLLLYEMSLPFGLDLNNQISVDKSLLRLVTAIQTLSSSQAIAFNERALDWLQSHAPHAKTAVGTGSILMFSHIGQRNIHSMLVGTSVALVLISGLLLLLLRSIKLGLISLAPNLLPPALGFGLWGVFNGDITLALAVVTSMTLGIIIDDTVHFLVKYQRARRTLGLSAENAVRETYREVAPAMLCTSLILIAGFAVLALSHFELNAGMGLLTAIVIGVALLLDLALLPTLLLFFEDPPDAPAGHLTHRTPPA